VPQTRTRSGAIAVVRDGRVVDGHRSTGSLSENCNHFDGNRVSVVC
jgi:hypothetical protein